MSSNTALRLVSSDSEIRRVEKLTPSRPKNADVRSREYLTPDEVEKLIQTARTSTRYGHRDATMILIAYHHGLRVSELVNLKWDQIDLRAAKIHVRRLKNGDDSTHILTGLELRWLRQQQRDVGSSPYVFLSERGTPMGPAGFAYLIDVIAKKAGIPFPVHPHQLRHACGYKLANQGVDTRSLQLYLGHKCIQNTTIYTQLSSHRFKDFWRD
jgi:site-specific recombinase XerD